MDYTALIGMVMQLAGKASGDAAASIPQAQLLELIKGAIDQYGKINVPVLQKLILEKAPDTELSKIKDDPAYRASQASADSQLNEIIQGGGLTLGDKAALNDIRGKILATQSAGRGAITNDMAQRGSLDSGNQLAMQLAQQQNAAQGEAQAGEHTAAQAQARMYAAIQERARLAGQGLDRSYNQKANAARAQDAINQGNIAIANTANKYNAGLGQQNFDNQLRLAQAKLNPTYALAGAYGAQANDARQSGADAGRIGAEGVNAFGKANTSTNSANDNNYPGSSDYYSGGRGSASDLTGGHTDYDYGDTGANLGGGGMTDEYYRSNYDYSPSGGAMTGESTRVIVGYDTNGNPIYRAY